jgi:hypothetical protein
MLNLGTQVIDPQNGRVFYQYQKGLLQANDREDLMEDGYLRVVFRSSK